MELDLSEGDDRRLRAYVSRVAALSPADWGRLDAMGARLADGAPTSRWRRAAVDAGALGLPRLIPDAPATAAAFVGRLAFDASIRATVAWRRLTDADPCAELATAGAPEPPEPPAAAALRERRHRHWAALRAAVGRQPGRRRAVERGDAAERCLEYGFHALLLRPMLPAESFARVYAVVEPVIPLASLDDERPRSGATT